MSAAIANVTTHFTMRQQGFHGTAASEDLDNSSLKYYCTLEGYYCKISYFCWLNRTSTIEKAFRYIKIFLWKTIIYIIYKDSKNWHKTYKMFLEGWYRQRRSSWKDSFGLSTFFHTRIWYPGGNCPVAVLSSAVWCDVGTRSVTTGAQSWPGTGGGNMSSLPTLLTLVTLVTRAVTQRPPRRGCEVDGISMCGYESHEQMVARLMALQQSFPGLARVSATCARRCSALKFLPQKCQRFYLLGFETIEDDIS